MRHAREAFTDQGNMLGMHQLDQRLPDPGAARPAGSALEDRVDHRQRALTGKGQDDVAGIFDQMAQALHVRRQFDAEGRLRAPQWGCFLWP